MKKNWSYDELYQCAEELQSLRGYRLDDVRHDGQYAFTLELSSEGGASFWLTISMNPTTPWILAWTRAPFGKAKKNVPALLFLRSHFVGQVLRSVYVAAKPDRKLRLEWSDGAEILLDCFPHGQNLALFHDKKHVFFPWKPERAHKNKAESLEPAAYVAPEPQQTWHFHHTWLAEVESDFTRPTRNDSQSWIQKKEAELLRSLEAIGKAFEDPELNAFSLEKLKQRQEEIRQRLHVLKTVPPTAPQKVKMPKNKSFSGAKILLYEPWQLWVGRSARQNDELLKLMGPHELWIHLRDYPGAHGAIRGPKNQTPPPSTVITACQIVAVMSQTKKRPFEDGLKLDFIVTPRKFVRKPKGAAPGRVLVERETIRRVAFRLIGFQTLP